MEHQLPDMMRKGFTTLAAENSAPVHPVEVIQQNVCQNSKRKHCKKG